MNKLSKEKRQQLVLTGLVTLLAICGLYFGIVCAQQRSLKTLKGATDAASQKLTLVKRSIQTADQTEQQLCDARKQLDKCEEVMASGDLYSWAITTIRSFKLNYRVEIPQFSAINGPKDMDLLPDFPYKHVTLTVGGTAAFNELGRFLADFENQFPHMRLLNLSLEPAPAQSAGEPKLAFKMDISALVKPNAS